MRLLLLIILFFNLSSLLQAQTYDTTYSELRRPGQAVRNLGMGNTGVALSADENALYYNPAGLGNVDSLMLNLSFLLEIPAISELQESQEKLNDGASVSIDLLHIRSLNSFSFIMPFGDWLTIELEIPVIPVIKDGMFFPGLTNVENVFLGSPFLKRIAATSIILS